MGTYCRLANLRPRYWSGQRTVGQLTNVILALLVMAGLLTADLGRASAAEQAPFAGHWIDVNLATLTATAYNGSRAVYSAPVTAGKRGYETPVGTYRIYSQVRVTDMRSSPGARESYYVHNVEYVQYFKAGGYALHSNYWAASSVFGRAFTSHGCISMRETHAAYFWRFADIGTPIYIHYSQPKVAVSKVVGKSQSAAKSQLQSAGFRVAASQQVTALRAAGTVLDQTPDGGTSATRGTTVKLVVAAAPKLVPKAWSMGSPYPPVLPYGDPGAKSTWSPSVVGVSESLAVSRIGRAGLQLVHVEYVDEASAPAAMRQAVKAARPGSVVASSATPGDVLSRGASYAIIVKRK